MRRVGRCIFENVCHLAEAMSEGILDEKGYKRDELEDSFFGIMVLPEFGFQEFQEGQQLKATREIDPLLIGPVLTA